MIDRPAHRPHPLRGNRFLVLYVAGASALAVLASIVQHFLEHQ